MRRPPTSRCVALALLSLLFASPLAAQSEEGATEGGIFLLLPVGARGVAMGRAMTALSGPESVFWNPAGLGELSDNRVVLYRGNYVAGDAISISGLISEQALGT